MSYLDPNGGESQGWQRQDGSAGPYWPDAHEEPRPRARHTGAAPEAFADTPGYAPVSGYRHGDGTVRRDGYPGGPTPYAGPDSPDAHPYRPDADPYQADERGFDYPGGDRPEVTPDGLTDPVGWAPIRGMDQPDLVGAGAANQWRTGLTGSDRARPDHVEVGHPSPGGVSEDMDVPDQEEVEPAGPRPRTGRRRAGRGRPATLPATSRAGRNLPAAIGVGLALGAAVVVPLFLYPPVFMLVVAAAIGVGIWEMTQAVRRSGAQPPLVPLVVGGVLMVGLAGWAGLDALSLGLLVTVLATMVWRLGDGPAGYQRDVTAATLIAVYVPFLGGFAALLAAEPTDGHLRVVVTIVAVVLSDTGGYVAGVLFGKHPMAPSVSPKKSWEGFAGSVLAAAGGSALLLALLLDVDPLWGALFGVAVSGASVLGDLGESMIKRDLGVKDMSNLLPGHGGLMDRLDSVLFAVPVAYLLLTILVPVG
ncbi:phosphatidate cytidylyltransferase [Micromonospora sp. NPDC050417]|uniref:phosphatidate cytidylyltransferase n=1 Tax=Micromonospora sp. NPDC050417 TaxID=3364280 RepID=UPI003793E823